MTENLRYTNSKAIRVSQIVLGVIAVVLSITVIAIPRAGILSLIYLLSFTVFVLGIERITAGILPHSKRSTRITNIMLGALALGLGVGVIAFPVLSTIFLVSLLSVGLLFLGIARIVEGVENKSISKWSRAFLVGVGILSLVVSFTVFADPLLGVILLTLLLAVNLMIIGIESIANGLSRRQDIFATSIH